MNKLSKYTSWGAHGHVSVNGHLSEPCWHRVLWCLKAARDGFRIVSSVPSGSPRGPGPFVLFRQNTSPPWQPGSSCTRREASAEADRNKSGSRRDLFNTNTSDWGTFLRWRVEISSKYEAWWKSLFIAKGVRHFNSTEMKRFILRNY